MTIGLLAKTIVEGEADYVLSVKEGQGHLYEDVSVLFAVNQAQNFKHASFEYAKTINKGYGRIEVRECWGTSNPQYLGFIRGRQFLMVAPSNPRQKVATETAMTGTNAGKEANTISP